MVRDTLITEIVRNRALKYRRLTALFESDSFYDFWEQASKENKRALVTLVKNGDEISVRKLLNRGKSSVDLMRQYDLRILASSLQICNYSRIPTETLRSLVKDAQETKHS